MRTLEDLRGRCRIEDDDSNSCWVCSVTRVFAPDNTPGGQLSTMTPRRAAWLLSHGIPLRSGYRVFSVCGTPDCVNPDHLRALTPAERGRRVAAAGLLKASARRTLASRATGRARARLSPDAVKEIMASPETGRALAARFGVSAETISKARRGRYVCYSALTNPWAALMQRGA